MEDQKRVRNAQKLGGEVGAAEQAASDAREEELDAKSAQLRAQSMKRRGSSKQREKPSMEFLEEAEASAVTKEAAGTSSGGAEPVESLEDEVKRLRVHMGRG